MAKRSRRHKVVVASAVAVVAVGGGVAWAATRTTGTVYRLASVERSDVTQTVTGVGAMSSVTQRTLSFAGNGTVKSVKVSIGSEVRAGQVVAQLDTTMLEQQVRSDESGVASAQQQLASDERAQSGSSGDSTDSFAQTPLVAAPSHGAGGGGSLAADQAAVVAAQQRVDALLNGPVSPRSPHVLSIDIAAMQSACATSAVTISTASTSDGVVSGSVAGGSGLPVSLVGGTYADGTPVPATTVAADGSYSFGSAAQPLRASASYTVQLGDASHGVVGSGECSAALLTVADDERAIQQAERDLAAAEHKLDTDLAAKASSTPSRTSSTPSSTRSGSQSSTPSRSSSSPNASTTITAAQLAADQKQIDAANARLAVSRQNLAAATLTSPIDGTVGAVSMTAGSSASPSSTSTITVIGHGRKAVTVQVGIGVIDSVHVGENASVTIDGVTNPMHGKVSEVGVLNTTGTSGSTSTYPVTVLLDATTLPIYDGAGATVAINVGTAHNVLTVPISAVHRTARGATVETYAGGKVTTQRVTLATVGTDRVEVTSGLTAGERVVLAEVSAPVPTDSTQTGRGRFAGVVTFGTGGGGAARRFGGGN